MTDRHLAVYLGRARGSAHETRAHLARALGRHYISPAEFGALDGIYVD